MIDLKERIEILRGTLKRLHIIHYQHLKNYIHDNDTELRIRMECRILYRRIRWTVEFENVHDKIRLFNIIFLRKYEQGIRYKD